MSERHHRPTRRDRHRRRDDDIPTVSDFGEAAMFALEVHEALGANDEAIAIIDARGRVVRIMVDVLVLDAACMWRPRRPVAERGDESILHVIVRPHVARAAPCDEDVESYHKLKAAYETLGRTMLDLMLSDGETVQSLAMAVEPDTAWGGAAADTDSA